MLFKLKLNYFIKILHYYMIKLNDKNYYLI